MPFDTTQDKGYTLIETLLYLGLVTVIITAALQTTFYLFDAKAKTQAIEEVSQQGRFVMNRMSAALRQADAITLPAVGSTGTALSLNMSDSGIQPTIFSLQEGTVLVKQGLSATTTLTAADVVVDSLVFTNITPTGSPGSVRITMTMSAVNPSGRTEYSYSQRFFVTENVHK